MRKPKWLEITLLVGAIAPHMFGQETPSHLKVISFQWTTTHSPITFSWPGHANTSCSGSSNINGYVSNGGNFSANSNGYSSCSTTYTPPIDQTIDVQKPVVFILAETESDRMVLTCTRNVRWSQCHGLSPGEFAFRHENGHFEVQAETGKGKEEWIKFDVVQQTAITRVQPPMTTSVEARTSIEAPKFAGSAGSSDFPARWKSMTSGNVRTLRIQGDYIYGEVVIPEAAAKAGVSILMDVKKDGDKYVGNVNAHLVKNSGGPICGMRNPIELTLVTHDRIEGRGFQQPPNSKLDWGSCTYSAPSEWQTFVWIPVE